MAHMLVETLAGDFDAAEFEDDYAGAVESLVKAKIEGGEVKRTATSTKSSGEVVDLLAALQQSVDAAKTARGEDARAPDEETGTREPAKKTAAKKTAAKKARQEGGGQEDRREEDGSQEDRPRKPGRTVISMDAAPAAPDACGPRVGNPRGSLPNTASLSARADEVEHLADGADHPSTVDRSLLQRAHDAWPPARRSRRDRLDRRRRRSGPIMAVADQPEADVGEGHVVGEGLAARDPRPGVERGLRGEVGRELRRLDLDAPAERC